MVFGRKSWVLFLFGRRWRPKNTHGENCVGGVWLDINQKQKGARGGLLFKEAKSSLCKLEESSGLSWWSTFSITNAFQPSWFREIFRSVSFLCLFCFCHFRPKNLLEILNGVLVGLVYHNGIDFSDRHNFRERFFLAKIMDDLGIDVAIPKWFKDQGILISFSLLFCIV